MRRVLVSSCLLGYPVRYHGGAGAAPHPVLVRWMEEGRVVPVCPEVAGGLSTPRPPAEIEPGGDGRQVLRRVVKVVDAAGTDVSEPFIAGAQRALALAYEHDVALAILKENSPSCGCHAIYGGHFDGTRVAGAGVTAACLLEAGFMVFDESQLAEAERCLATLERS